MEAICEQDPFVLEDLTNVSFAGENLRKLEKRTLEYKAEQAGSMVIKVDPSYTSRRCPKCRRIHKSNRRHEKQEYECEACGYRSNDDRIGVMNLYELGTLSVSGDHHPGYGVRKKDGNPFLRLTSSHGFNRGRMSI